MSAGDEAAREVALTEHLGLRGSYSSCEAFRDGWGDGHNPRPHRHWYTAFPILRGCYLAGRRAARAHDAATRAAQGGGE